LAQAFCSVTEGGTRGKQEITSAWLSNVLT